MTDAPETEPEFTFELRLCRWAEATWTPRQADSVVLVSRQLGIKRRRWDTIVLECDPDALYARGVFGPEALDSDLLHVVRNAPREWAFYRDCLPHPGYPWRYVREAVKRAAARGIVETRRGKNGRIELRREWRYPDWIRRIVAIENKPDLDASAARALAPQLERDVALSLADEVWVATRATGREIEPALLERLPVEAGILAFSEGDCEVVWEPRTLPVSEPGTRILERPSGTTHDQSAARFEYASAEWKAGKRREIAERAYEKGWRAYADTMRTDCRHFQLREPAGPLPWCAAKGRSPTDRECSGRCGEFSPEPPAWRQQGWPLDGGPGRAAKRLLAEQRARRR